jgi:hypothetical protein
MVNRKSRNANFIQHGSPRKKILEQVGKKKLKITPQKLKHKFKKNNYAQRHLKKTIHFLDSILLTVKNNEAEFIRYISDCINSEEKTRIEEFEYLIISDKFQLIISAPFLGKIMVSKTHLKNALSEVLEKISKSDK